MDMTINEQLDALFGKLELTYQDDTKPEDSFNVFEAFRIEHSELAWSAWIAYLLNPQGNHGCGDIFLRLFLKHVSLPEDYVKVAHGKIVEKEIGQIDKKYESGGRIDIIVHDPDVNKAIIIENKIFADDQEKQLYRYYKYANIGEEKFNDSRIFYLTLLKSKPSKTSIKGDDKNIGEKGELQEGKHFFCISYIDDIKTWLETCMAECDKSKPVRSIIEQSITMIDSMCRQTVVDEEFRDKVEEVLNANGKTSIERRLEVLKKVKIDKYHQCSEQISSLIKIYQRDLFSEMIHNHFPSADISQEGKLDGYWTSTANIHHNGVRSIQIMHDWEIGQLICCVECDSTELVSELRGVKGVWYKENKNNPLYWSVGLDDFDGLYSILKDILDVVCKIS